MARSGGQKYKLISILKLLEEETDEDHKLNASDLIKKLEAMDICAERKSIYADIEALRDLGYDIVLDTDRKTGGYFLAERPLEKYELTLLADAVSSSKFITEKKTRELIKKLEGLLSKYEAKDLEREVFVANRIKSDNEAIYITCDTIHRAIREHKKISFKYCEWNLDKELVPRRDGKTYIASPISLIWDDEYYYLVALENDAGNIRHYRVDKMKNAIVTEEVSEKSSDDLFDPGKYSKKTFGMYGGREETVTLMFPANLIGVAIDRFGQDISVRKLHDGDFFSFRADVFVSGQFFGWLAGLGSEVSIMAPESVRNEYVEFMKKALKGY